MRTALTCFAAFLLIAGCDSISSPATTSTLPLAEVRSADVIYDLEPLARGESFAVAVDGTAGPITMRSTRRAAGYDVTMDLGALKATSVQVRYLANGQEVAPTAFLPVDGPLYSGTSDEGPDSWHYVWRNGNWVLVKDYKREVQTADARGTRFTTPSGEVVYVTDVEYRISGIDAPPPTAVRFETPRGFAITSQKTRPEATVATLR